MDKKDCLPSQRPVIIFKSLSVYHSGHIMLNYSLNLVIPGGPSVEYRLSWFVFLVQLSMSYGTIRYASFVVRQ